MKFIRRSRFVSAYSRRWPLIGFLGYPVLSWTETICNLLDAQNRPQVSWTRSIATRYKNPPYSRFEPSTRAVVSFSRCDWLLDHHSCLPTVNATLDSPCHITHGLSWRGIGSPLASGWHRDGRAARIEAALGLSISFCPAKAGPA